MRKMRRKDRTITESEARSLLKKAEYGVLSTVASDGSPYGVPLNFCVIDDCIYFHCAVEGQKIDNIEHNKFVSFCVVGNIKICMTLMIFIPRFYSAYTGLIFIKTINRSCLI